MFSFGLAKRIFVIFFSLLILGMPFMGEAYVSVKGYYRKDGTYVKPYVRSNPNGIKYDNYSWTSSEGLYNDSYGSRGTDWDTPTWNTDPDYYEGKSIYENNQESYNNYSNNGCPLNSYLKTDGGCYCKTGYKANENNDGCLKVICSENAFLSDNSCKCKTGYIMNADSCISHTENCMNKYGENIYGLKKDETTSSCYCETGYKMNAERTSCVEINYCRDYRNGYLDEAGECVCYSGDIWDGVNSKCIKGVMIADKVEIVKEKVLEVDIDLTNRLRGKILLQVEDLGQAWYVNPVDGIRHYMKDGAKAYRIMRDLGIGITNTDLDKVMNDLTFSRKYKGKIFLQVEDLGQAYYIDFEGKAHFLKDGAAAYQIMRDLGLGITNNDLSKIQIN